MRMKKVFCISVICSFLALCFAEDITITYVMNSGREFQKVVSSESTSLVLNLPRMHVKEIKGLELLPHVKNLKHSISTRMKPSIPKGTNMQGLLLLNIR